MNRRALFTFGLFFFAPAVALAEHSAFKPGENLRYKIKWGFVTAGYASMSVPGRINYRGVDCLVLQTRARSSGALGYMFPVRDVITSYWDPVKRRTLFSRKALREGNYHRRAVVYLYPDSRLARWSEKEFSGNTDKMGEKRKGAKWKERAGVSRNLPRDALDMLSAIYFNRSDKRRGKPGMSFRMNVFDDSKLTSLRMSILRREKLTLTVNGREETFPALVVRPYIKTSGIFKSKGKTLIWISDDNRRWPLMIQAKAPVVGSLKIRLFEAKGVTERRE